MTPTGPLQQAIVHAIVHSKEPIYISHATVPGFDGSQIHNALNRLRCGGLIAEDPDGRYRLASRVKR